ncbi:MAG: HNH endonuclease [Sedimentisphaerales bacterium]|nr:HNH endonuclease [Sedimentisphaerales bacterium]
MLLLYRRIRYGYPFRRILLGNSNVYAIVDPDDYDYLIQFKWRYKPAPYSAYASRTVYYNKTKQNEYMHRVIMASALKEYAEKYGVPASDLMVDHKNRNTMDNRKVNLRIATARQNVWNSIRGKNAGKSKYKGVRWVKSFNKWQVILYIQGRRKSFGFFEDEEAAARAYDSAAKKHRGDFAYLNFP